MPTIVRQFLKWSNLPMLHEKLPHLIYFALANNYFNVFMSTTVLLGLTSFEQIGGQWIFWGTSTFSNLLAPWASGSRSLMLRAAQDPEQWPTSLTVSSESDRVSVTTSSSAAVIWFSMSSPSLSDWGRTKFNASFPASVQQHDKVKVKRKTSCISEYVRCENIL